jgi:hypothetical protein
VVVPGEWMDGGGVATVGRTESELVLESIETLAGFDDGFLHLLECDRRAKGVAGGPYGEGPQVQFLPEAIDLME